MAREPGRRRGRASGGAREEVAEGGGGVAQEIREPTFDAFPKPEFMHERRQRKSTKRARSNRSTAQT
jgi:hypothetical protein